MKDMTTGSNGIIQNHCWRFINRGTHMTINKKEILENICYTELVYGRINKKLNIRLSKKQIEEFILKILKETERTYFSKIGKNFYVVNTENNVRLTINSKTFRIITADRLEG
jgi:hypothetical protein